MSVRIITGDCRDVLKTLPDASIDSVVTDPPYELGFMGKAWDKSGIAYDHEVWGECLRVLKPGGYLLAFGGSRTYHRMACTIEDSGFEVRDQIMWLYGSGFPKSFNLKGEHEGKGTALKPAHEPILMARKPLVGTVLENVTQHGTGTLNIDDCRIDAGNEVIEISGEKEDMARSTIHAGYDRPGSTMFRTGKPTERGGPSNELGRWPANVLHDGSVQVLTAFPEAKGQQGDLVGHSKDRLSKGIFGDMKAAREAPKRGDSGSAARFFYCAKASRAERDAGLEDLPVRSGGEATDRMNDSAGLKSPRAGAGQLGGVRNTHPTIKPLALMQYLTRLVTPLKGCVLDPFAGSGTTGIAAVREGFHCILIELNPEYAAMAERRIHDDAPLFVEVNK